MDKTEMSSAFGTQTAKVDSRTVHSSKDAEAYYGLNSKQDYEVERTKRISEAMKNPADYYSKRAVALEAVKAESSKHFGAQYASLIKLNVPHQEAITRATALADSMRTLLMANLEEDYPADINQLSLQLVSNVARAPGGFIQPNAAVPSGAGGGRRKRK